MINVMFSRNQKQLTVEDFMPQNIITASEAFYLAFAFVMGGIGGLSAGVAAMLRDALQVDGAKSKARIQAIRESHIPWWAFGAVLFLAGGGGGVLIFFVLWLLAAFGMIKIISETLVIMSASTALGYFFASLAVGGAIFREMRKTKEVLLDTIESTGIHTPGGDRE